MDTDVAVEMTRALPDVVLNTRINTIAKWQTVSCEVGTGSVLLNKIIPSIPLNSATLESRELSK